jgi:hypothetical protein
VNFALGTKKGKHRGTEDAEAQRTQRILFV